MKQLSHPLKSFCTKLIGQEIRRTVFGLSKSRFSFYSRYIMNLQQRFSQLVVNGLASCDVIESTERITLYKLHGLHVGIGAYISSRCHFVYPPLSNVRIGKKAFLNQFCYLENGAEIEIGDDSCLGSHVHVLTTTHEISSADRRVGNSCVKRPVRIGRGVWIGSGVTIFPGVTVSDGCVIGAGALVREDCEPNGLYVGFPAKRKRDLAESDYQALEVANIFCQNQK